MALATDLRRTNLRRKALVWLRLGTLSHHGRGAMVLGGSSSPVAAAVEGCEPAWSMGRHLKEGDVLGQLLSPFLYSDWTTAHPHPGQVLPSSLKTHKLTRWASLLPCLVSSVCVRVPVHTCGKARGSSSCLFLSLSEPHLSLNLEHNCYGLPAVPQIPTPPPLQ